MLSPKCKNAKKCKYVQSCNWLLIYKQKSGGLNTSICHFYAQSCTFQTRDCVATWVLSQHKHNQLLRLSQSFPQGHFELHALPLRIQVHLGLKPEVHLFGSVAGHLQVTTVGSTSFETTWRPLSAISKFLSWCRLWQQCRSSRNKGQSVGVRRRV